MPCLTKVILAAGDLLANLQQLKAGSVEVLSKELGVTTAQAGESQR